MTGTRNLRLYPSTSSGSRMSAGGSVWGRLCMLLAALCAFDCSAAAVGGFGARACGVQCEELVFAARDRVCTASASKAFAGRGLWWMRKVCALGALGIGCAEQKREQTRVEWCMCDPAPPRCSWIGMVARHFLFRKVPAFAFGGGVRPLSSCLLPPFLFPSSVLSFLYFARRPRTSH
ncbi:hypothetical protein B0H16DRAFT_123423 [Mycena metata]|uniref:Uncharacterized protein n=1 Tax=Mycena metata TaxID=1033252 RepID=A0AAD7I885_9AGAR|nr:hypothetical protein B0H16DRAFT_123423 [Mycena metata]